MMPKRIFDDRHWRRTVAIAELLLCVVFAFLLLALFFTADGVVFRVTSYLLGAGIVFREGYSRVRHLKEGRL